jgi:hypothetical protein
VADEKHTAEPADAELLALAKDIRATEWCRHGRRLGLTVCLKLAREVAAAKALDAAATALAAEIDSEDRH